MTSDLSLFDNAGAGSTETPITNEIIEAGDLWQLGTHRLLCGDAGDWPQVSRLLGKEAGAHTVFTDPPYNVAATSRSLAATTDHSLGVYLNKKRRVSKRQLATGGAKHDILVNDKLSDADFRQRLSTWIGNLARALLPGRAIYMWGGYANIGNIPNLFERHDIHWAQQIIWHKISPMLNRMDFLAAHEWCFYGWKNGAPHVFVGPSNVPDVWSMRKVTPRKAIHLTEKPIGLPIRGIECSSRVGEIVLDLFGGSGSTLMAAEQCKRRCLMMEISPEYCHLIIQRWERFTGKKAKKIV